MELNKRMKKYESVTQTRLMQKTPVIIRVDGKAFHTFTRGFKKPYDTVLTDAMETTMAYLCKSVQGCILGYTQSDEITLLLQDWAKNDTHGWFDYEIQKICSISAGMATMKFNQAFSYLAEREIERICDKQSSIRKSDDIDRIGALQTAQKNGAVFDSRCFNVPFNEVENVFIWRQQDATRNSIQSLAQSLYSNKELQGICNNMLQTKMFVEKDVNWNDLPTKHKRGCCCKKDESGKWKIDKEVPIFTQDREYIKDILNGVEVAE